MLRRMVTFTELMDDAALLSFEHQLHMTDLLGVPAWHMNLDVPRFALTLDDGSTFACTDVQALGTAAPGPRSWLWAWAELDGQPRYRDEVITAANQVRAFGEQHGIAELTRPEVPFDALPYGLSEPLGVASHMMEVAKAITGRYTGYNAPLSAGTRMGLLIDHPDLRLPPATGTRVSRVFGEGLIKLTFENQRRGVAAYARARGLDVEQNGDLTRVTAPNLTAVLRFDGLNRMVAATIETSEADTGPEPLGGGDHIRPAG
jgi:hypothetical protein